jgi:hypothetical protein
MFMTYGHSGGAKVAFQPQPSSCSLPHRMKYITLKISLMHLADSLKIHGTASGIIFRNIKLSMEEKNWQK